MQQFRAPSTTFSRARPAGGALRPLVSGSGTLVGCVFFAASLTPSLVPRDALMQGVIGGAVFAIGYGIAIAVLSLWRWLELPEPHSRFTGLWAGLAILIGLALIGYGLAHAADWQSSVRAVVGLPPVEKTHTPVMLAIAALTAAVLFLAAWVLRLKARLVSRRVGRYVPPRVAFFTGLAVAFLVSGALVDGVFVRYALRVLDASYARLDQLVEPDTAEPAEPWRTGSAQSLVPWWTLGRAGRRFVEDVTTEGDLAAFWSAPVTEPVRVYVGLNSADDVEARSDLALAELLRVGAFDRSILVVAVPTGTGFMDNGAIRALEHLHRGDVATVAVQYSYLQSPFSLFFEPGFGAETARALLRTVYAHWTELPRDRRPRLFLYGLSLGALASERSVRLHEVVGDPFDGALWAGPPFLAPIHRELTADRASGSPEWLPRFEDGAFARFMNQWTVSNDGERWGPMRILYLQHASDPIVFFDVSLLWRRPAWLKAPRAPDVTREMRWVPVVTALQIAADMALSNAVPPGYGHNYAPARYVDAWEALTDPDVSAHDLARLKLHLQP